MSTVREKLIAARALIEDPKRWTKGEYARDKNNKRTDARSSEAVCFCALGALIRVTNMYDEWRPAVLRINITSTILYAAKIQRVNDSRSRFGDPHAAVLAIYDKAIADCRDAS